MNEGWLESIHAPRFTAAAFPPYRFLPGRDPHPTASPNGHSYLPPGEAEPSVVLHAAESWRDSTEYLYGCDLYNHGYWWEAHEAWETLWHLPARGSLQRRFLQGLIQVAACHLKLRLKRADGVNRLRESSSGYLTSVIADVGEAPYMGLRVSRFLQSVDEYYAAVYRPAEGALDHDPRIFPYCLPGC